MLKALVIRLSCPEQRDGWIDELTNHLTDE